jgi:protein TIF31
LGGVEVEPAYVKATPESIRKTIVDGVKTRFRWTLVDNDLELGLRKKQLLRELAMRVGFQLLQKSYRFDSATAEQVVSDDDKVNKVSGGKDKKDKKTKKRRNEEVTVSNTTFQPSDILSLIPIVRSTAPSVRTVVEMGWRATN